MAEGHPGCSEAQLRDAEGRLHVRLPDRLRELWRAGDGRYRSDGQWWVVWPLDRLVADNLDALQAEMLSRDLIAIGDDGTGNPFCAPVDGRDEIIRWSWIDGEPEYSAGTLDQFLAEWVYDSVDGT